MPFERHRFDPAYQPSAVVSVAFTPQTPLYLADYAGPRVKLSRTVYHINNGGGGSAPYAMLSTPWNSSWKYFTEPPSVALITVDGARVNLTAFRAETFGRICEDVKLR